MANSTQLNASASHVIDLTGWLMSIDRNTFFGAMDFLELRKDKEQPMLFQSLMRRLAGDYNPEDFVANEDFETEEDLRFHRDERLVSYFYDEGQKYGIPADPEMIQTLNATILDYASRKSPLANSTQAYQNDHSDIEAGSTSTENNSLPLSVTQNAHKTTFAPTSAGYQIDATNVTPSITVPISTALPLTKTDNTVLYTLQNGSSIKVPREVAAELYNYQYQLKLLGAINTKISNQQQSFMTHPTQQRTVGFNDTFDINYYNTSAPSDVNRTNTPPQSLYNPISSTQVPSLVKNIQVPSSTHFLTDQMNHLTRLPAQNPLPDQNIFDNTRPLVQSSSTGPNILYNPGPIQQNLVPGQNILKNARPMQHLNVLTSTPFQNTTYATPTSYTNQNSSKPYDVGRTVRAWNIKFSGEKGESIDNFLLRIEECSILANILEIDLLNATTEMLTGVALQWCRQEKYKWTSWADFKFAAIQRFGIDKRYQDQLTLEAQNRTQHPEELTCDYIDRLLTLLNALEEKWSTQRKLDLLISNLHPKARRYIPRERITSVDNLRLYAKEADFLIEAEKSYKLPTPPEKALRPDTAFTPKSKPVQKQNNSISAVTQEKKPAEKSNKNTDWKADIDKLIAEQIKALMPQKANQDNNKTSENKVQESKKESSQNFKSNSDKTICNDQAKKSTNKKPWKRRPRFKSTKNADKPPGPLDKLVCYGCAWPGYYTVNCPECSQSLKDQGSD